MMWQNDNDQTGYGSTKTIIKSAAYPERILQFGAGKAYRKIPDSGIDLITKEKLVNSSVVVVMTSQNQSSALHKTGNSYVSRVLYAKEQWPDVLAVGADPELKIIILNKGHVRKNMLSDSIYSIPPFSFPGKLLALLFTRFEKFRGETGKGIIIVSADNDQNSPEVVQSILLEMAHRSKLTPGFLDWIENANYFCN